MDNDAAIRLRSSFDGCHPVRIRSSCVCTFEYFLRLQMAYVRDLSYTHGLPEAAVQCRIVKGRASETHLLRQSPVVSVRRHHFVSLALPRLRAKNPTLLGLLHTRRRLTDFRSRKFRHVRIIRVISHRV